jgi:hypothetical protein
MHARLHPLRKRTFMRTRTRRLIALAGLAALAFPATAAAKDGHRGRDRDKQAEKRHGHGHKAKRVKTGTFVFKGVYGGDGAVEVTGGNSRVRRSGLVGTVVTFDLSGARLRVADVNGDGAADAADLQAGDRVVVQARLPRGVELDEDTVVTARKLVDRTAPESDDDEPGDDDSSDDDVADEGDDD